MISIIIACRNEARHIESCLNSILNQEQPKGGFEVIVADGMSEDGTKEMVENVESRKQKAENAISVRLIDNPGKIVSTGLNAAIRGARGEIIIRMDAHTEYAPDYVVQCVNTLLKTCADNVGGPARTRAVGYLQRAAASAYHAPFACGGALFHSPDYEGWVDTVAYGCWRREVFEKFGYFDEELVRNQDDEHNLRITRGGGRIWQSPRIRSWYHPRASLSALFRQYNQYGYWKVRVIQKHKLPASWRHLVPGAFVFTLLLLALCSLLSGVLNGTTDHGPRTTDVGQWSVVSGQWSMVSSCFLLSTLCFLSLLGLYGLCVLAASIMTAAKTEWKLLPILPLVFACYHFGYGFGFLRGVFDFAVCRRSPSAAFTTLTRPSATKGEPLTTDHRLQSSKTESRK